MNGRRLGHGCVRGPLEEIHRHGHEDGPGRRAHGVVESTPKDGTELVGRADLVRPLRHRAGDSGEVAGEQWVGHDVPVVLLTRGDDQGRETRTRVGEVADRVAEPGRRVQVQRTPDGPWPARSRQPCRPRSLPAARARSGDRRPTRARRSEEARCCRDYRRCGGRLQSAARRAGRRDPACSPSNNVTRARVRSSAPTSGPLAIALHIASLACCHDQNDTACAPWAAEVLMKAPISSLVGVPGGATVETAVVRLADRVHRLAERGEEVDGLRRVFVGRRVDPIDHRHDRVEGRRDLRVRDSPSDTQGWVGARSRSADSSGRRRRGAPRRTAARRRVTATRPRSGVSMSALKPSSRSPVGVA